MPHFRGWRHFYCHFPLVLQGNSSLPSISAAVQCVAVWIVCYYPAGDNIITTYLLSRVCKEWYHRGPWWSNKLTRCCWITHSYRQEVKHSPFDRWLNKWASLSHNPPPSLHHGWGENTPRWHYCHWLFSSLYVTHSSFFLFFFYIYFNVSGSALSGHHIKTL